MNKTEYYICENATINEGITTGTITHANMIFVKDYIYIIPFDSLGVMGNKATTTEFTNSDDFMDYLMANIESLPFYDFHEKMRSFLPEERIFTVKALRKLKISTGWLTAGMRIKKESGNLKVINIKPKSLLKELKSFYKL